jgi:hypothetical protein
MRTRMLIAASALLLGMSSLLGMPSGAMAQVLYAEPGYGAVVYGYGAVPYGYYDYAPGYSYGYGWNDPYHNSERGGPGPRVGSGQGMGAGSQR